MAQWHQKRLLIDADADGNLQQKYLLWGPIVPNEWDKILAMPVFDEWVILFRGALMKMILTTLFVIAIPQDKLKKKWISCRRVH